MPVTPTYDLIASNVLSSSASSVTFSSIPATYRDLIVVCNWLSASGTTYVAIRLNGDTGSNYPRVWAKGDGSSATTNTTTGSYIFAETDAQTTEKGMAIFQFLDYSATDKHKSVLLRADRAGQATNFTAARWADTAAVNEIQINAFTNDYAAGSTFYLYGIVS